MLQSCSTIPYSFNDFFLLTVLFFTRRGANPNAKTIATEQLRSLANARREAREKSIKENRTRIISLEKSKAMKRIKELKEKQEKGVSNKVKQQSSKKIADQRTDLSLNINKTSTDLNPFADDSNQDSNPFLNTPVDSAYSDGNPFSSEGRD